MRRRTNSANKEKDERDFKRDLLAVLPNLRAFACSLSGSPSRADDLVQDTIMKAWAKQESFEPGTNMNAWLFTILRNEFYSQMRKAKREVQDSEGTFADSLAVLPSQHGTLDLQDFRRALARLPDGQREALILVGASGYSYEEVGEICGCAVGTVKSRVSRARENLKQMLGVSDESEFGPDSNDAEIAARPSVL